MDLLSRFDRLLFQQSPARQICGIRVAVWAGSKVEEELVFGKIEAALALLTSHAPCRLARLVRHARGIFIIAPLAQAGEWKQSLRMVYLNRHWLISEENSPVDVAGVLIHEATHGWLFHLGIGYEPPIRARIEAVCARAALGFARGLPDAKALIENVEWQLARHPGYWSNDSLKRNEIWAFLALGLPLWTEKVWRARFRLSPGLTIVHTPDPCDRVQWDPARQAYLWSYTTEVRNDTDVPLQIVKFWPSVRERFRWWRADDPDDKPSETEEFARCFGVEGGWIEPRRSVVSTKLCSRHNEPAAWKMRWRFLARDSEENPYHGDGIVRLSRVPAAIRRSASARTGC